MPFSAISLRRCLKSPEAFSTGAQHTHLNHNRRHLEGIHMTTEQKPLKSGFGAKTTAREVLAGSDLTGKIAIVTGGYSGVGLETTRALAEAGATVVVPARTLEKARTALDGIPRVELETLELIDPASIDAFADRFLDSGRPLDILINNAGIMAPPLQRDARGYESQFATNHLGHFQLTARLWPALQRAGHARVVSVSSTGIASGGSISTTHTLNGGSTTSGRPTGSPRQPT